MRHDPPSLRPVPPVDPGDWTCQQPFIQTGLCLSIAGTSVSSTGGSLVPMWVPAVLCTREGGDVCVCVHALCTRVQCSQHWFSCPMTHVCVHMHREAFSHWRLALTQSCRAHTNSAHEFPFWMQPCSPLASFCAPRAAGRERARSTHTHTIAHKKSQSVHLRSSEL